MAEFAHVDQHVFERSASGAVCAGIWFNFGQTTFPGDGWDDFATLVLAAAVEGAQRVLEGTSSTAEVHFMEGPYYLRMKMFDEMTMSISANSRHGKGAILHEQTVDAIAFSTDLATAAERLLSWCRLAKWISSDEIRLEDSVASLHDSIARRSA
jgi:hypothetical protein